MLLRHLAQSLSKKPVEALIQAGVYLRDKYSDDLSPRVIEAFFVVLENFHKKCMQTEHHEISLLLLSLLFHLSKNADNVKRMDVSKSVIDGFYKLLVDFGLQKK